MHLGGGSFLLSPLFLLLSLYREGGSPQRRVCFLHCTQWLLPQQWMPTIQIIQINTDGDLTPNQRRFKWLDLNTPVAGRAAQAWSLLFSGSRGSSSTKPTVLYLELIFVCFEKEDVTSSPDINCRRHQHFHKTIVITLKSFSSPCYKFVNLFSTADNHKSLSVGNSTRTISRVCQGEHLAIFQKRFSFLF